MSRLSIKRIRRLIDEEKPKAIARYLKQFLPSDKHSQVEVKLDEYAHKLIVDGKHTSKAAVLKKIEELSKSHQYDGLVGDPNNDGELMEIKYESD